MITFGVFIISKSADGSISGEDMNPILGQILVLKIALRLFSTLASIQSFRVGIVSIAMGEKVVGSVNRLQYIIEGKDVLGAVNIQRSKFHFFGEVMHINIIEMKASTCFPS